MRTTISKYAIDREKAVKAIMKLRREWEDTACGDSLLEVNGSIGYLLFDVAVGLGLNEDEMQLALGQIGADLKDV
jgi:hypothetical protein